MTRGGPEKRTRLVAIRLTDAEWAAWEWRRSASGRKEMAAWVRATVNDATDVPVEATRGRQPRRAGDVPVVPEANAAAAAELARAANNANQLARAVNAQAGAQLAPVILEQIHDTIAELAAAAKALRGQGGER